MIKSFVIIFILHLFAGFFMQSDKISKLKREKKRYLTKHVAYYTSIFIVLSPILLGLTIMQGIVYSLINGVLHYVVDYLTGKLKVKYTGISEIKYHWIVIADYSIHLIILVSTYFYLYPNAYQVVTFWDKY